MLPIVTHIHTHQRKSEIERRTAWKRVRGINKFQCTVRHYTNMSCSGCAPTLVDLGVMFARGTLLRWLEDHQVYSVLEMDWTGANRSAAPVREIFNCIAPVRDILINTNNMKNLNFLGREIPFIVDRSGS